MVAQILTLPVFSVSTDSADWVAIVRAENSIQAATVAVAAMDPVIPPSKMVHVITQDNNPDAVARLGARELIGWHFHARPN